MSSASPTAPVDPARLDLALITASPDPDVFWSRTRRDRPVFYSPEHDCWLVTRNEDARTVLGDPTTFSSASAFTSHLDLPNEVLEILGRRLVVERMTAALGQFLHSE